MKNCKKCGSSAFLCHKNIRNGLKMWSFWISIFSKKNRFKIGFWSKINFLHGLTWFHCIHMHDAEIHSSIAVNTNRAMFIKYNLCSTLSHFSSIIILPIALLFTESILKFCRSTRSVLFHSISCCLFFVSFLLLLTTQYRSIFFSENVWYRASFSCLHVICNKLALRTDSTVISLCMHSTLHLLFYWSL